MDTEKCELNEDLMRSKEKEVGTHGGRRGTPEKWRLCNTRMKQEDLLDILEGERM